MNREKEDMLAIDQTFCRVHTYEHCITCGDEALCVRVLQLDPTCSTALVEIEGIQEEVDISLVDAIAPGDFLLVHGGVAIGIGFEPEREVRDVHA